MVTAQPWRHHGELTDLPGAVTAAAIAAGLVPVERCVALLTGLSGDHLVARPSFFQLDNTRKARARGEPWHLIVHEDVLIFRSPLSQRFGSGRACRHGGARSAGSRPCGQAGGVSGSSRLRLGSLCTGYGGLDLAVMAVLDADLAWCSETDQDASAVLAARFPGVPNLGDLTTADWAAAPPVDMVTAGFPCQDISSAGHGAGITKGTRSGLWTRIAHAVRDLRPGYVLVENVAALRSRGLCTVLADLASLGYDAQWASVRASDAGAAHHRDRIFVLAHQPAALPRLLAAARSGDRHGARRHWPVGAGQCAS